MIFHFFQFLIGFWYIRLPPFRLFYVQHFLEALFGYAIIIQLDLVALIMKSE